MSDCIDYAITASGSWAEVDEQNLVVSDVDDVFQLLFQPQQIDRIELAFEDRVLEMVAPISHRFEDFAKPFIVADVVGDQIDVAHDGIDLAGILGEQNVGLGGAMGCN